MTSKERGAKHSRATLMQFARRAFTTAPSNRNEDASFWRHTISTSTRRADLQADRRTFHGREYQGASMLEQQCPKPLDFIFDPVVAQRPPIGRGVYGNDRFV